MHPLRPLSSFLYKIAKKIRLRVGVFLIIKFITPYIFIGLIFSSLIASTARNPQIRSQLFSYAPNQTKPKKNLGFSLAEATGLFSLMIAFLLLYS